MLTLYAACPNIDIFFSLYIGAIIQPYVSTLYIASVVVGVGAACKFKIFVSVHVIFRKELFLPLPKCVASSSENFKLF